MRPYWLIKDFSTAKASSEDKFAAKICFGTKPSSLRRFLIAAAFLRFFDAPFTASLS